MSINQGVEVWMLSRRKSSKQLVHSGNVPFKLSGDNRR